MAFKVRNTYYLPNIRTRAVEPKALNLVTTIIVIFQIWKLRLRE